MAFRVLETRRCDKCTLANKKAYGCEKDIKPYDFFGEKLTRCPLRMVLDEPELLNELTEHYRWYERGDFPSPGTWYDQTSPWLDLMEAIKQGHAVADGYEQDKVKRRQQQRDELAAGAPRRGTGAG